MSSSDKYLATQIANSLNTDIPVRPANLRRGASYRDAAIDFIKKWPLQSHLTWEEFCLWAYEEGLLEELPPKHADKKSKEWLAHLQLRHQAKTNLNKAASHPSMIPYGGAFFIASSAGGLFVRSTAQQMIEGGLTKSVGDLANTKRKQLEYLIQSTDWAQLPEPTRNTVEDLKDDLDNWIARVSLDAEHMENRLSKLKGRLDRMVKSGDVKALNGGIAGLLESDDNED